MKRKKTIITITIALAGIVLVGSFLAFQAVCIVGYILMDQRFKQNEAVFEQIPEYCIVIQAYVQEDVAFESEYGEVKTVVWNGVSYRSQSKDELIIPCIVETGNGQSYTVSVEYQVSTGLCRVQYDSVQTAGVP